MCGATVILQTVRIKLGVGVLQIPRARETAIRPALQVVPLRVHSSATVANCSAVVGQNAPAYVHYRLVLTNGRIVNATGASGGGRRVAGDCTVCDHHPGIIFIIEATTFTGTGVEGNRTVSEACMTPETGADPSASSADERTVRGGSVVGNRTTGDGQTAVDAAAAVDGTGYAAKVTREGTVGDVHHASAPKDTALTIRWVGDRVAGEHSVGDGHYANTGRQRSTCISRCVIGKSAVGDGQLRPTIEDTSAVAAVTGRSWVSVAGERTVGDRYHAGSVPEAGAIAAAGGVVLICVAISNGEGIEGEGGAAHMQHAHSRT